MKLTKQEKAIITECIEMAISAIGVIILIAVATVIYFKV